MANYKLLVIDDAFFIRNLIKKAIAKKPTSNNTFEIIGEAQDGQSGLDMCELLKPDIITVDFNIPTINGLDFARHLKELHPEIPIIMISSNIEQGFSARVKEAGCRLLTKPFQEAYLWKLLDEVAFEIENTDFSQLPQKSAEDKKKILEELTNEIKGEIIPLKEERKDISSEVLVDIKTEKAKNIGFSDEVPVIEIKTESRRRSGNIIVEEPKSEDFVLEFDDSDDINIDFDDENTDFVIEDNNVENTNKELSEIEQKKELLQSTVTYSYLDYMGPYIYKVQNPVQPEILPQKTETIIVSDTPIESVPIVEKTAEDDFDKMLLEFETTGSISETEAAETKTWEKVLIDPPTDRSILNVYGDKAADLMSTEEFVQLNPEANQEVQATEVVEESKKKWWQKFFDFIFRRKSKKME